MRFISDGGKTIMKRTAQAHWQGDLKNGAGSLTSASHTLNNTRYSFHSRFEEGQGTNPEELLAAAHAGCFTMALSAQLMQAGMTASSLDTVCTITLEKKGEGFEITGSHLELKATVPGAAKQAFDAAVHAAETGCPVSKLYKAPITVNAVLES
jgi:lipoyl-dependent peroxiredoxin